MSISDSGATVADAEKVARKVQLARPPEELPERLLARPRSKRVVISGKPKGNKSPVQQKNALSGEDYLEAHELVIHEEGAPPPCRSLSDAPFPAPLVRILKLQAGFVRPSPVQSAAWPIAVAGRYVLAIAKTGSGKTLGFLLPLIAECIMSKKKGSTQARRPIGIITAPTRELAL